MNTRTILAIALGLVILTAVSYFLVFSNQSTSQEKTTVSYNNIIVTPIEGASFTIQWDENILAFDPTGDANRYGEVDMVFITDIHEDNLSTSTLQSLDTEQAYLVTPQEAMDALGGSVYFPDIEVISNGEKETVRDYQVQAVAMYNVPETEDSHHPKGRGNGYLIEKDNVRIYVAGDTGNHRLIRGLKDIDIAFVPMSEPFTMSVEDAAEAVLAFEPSVVYPYHYRGKEEYSDIEKFQTLVNDTNPKINVRLANWYPERELGTSFIDDASLEEDPARKAFEAASTVGTTESYQTFIKTHRGHPLAEEAKFELNNLRGISNN